MATFNVIESTIALIVTVHTGIGTNGSLILGETTEITIIEITRGRAEGMTGEFFNLQVLVDLGPVV